jgi:hypothetical protein
MFPLRTRGPCGPRLHGGGQVPPVWGPKPYGPRMPKVRDWRGGSESESESERGTLISQIVDL